MTKREVLVRILTPFAFLLAAVATLSLSAEARQGQPGRAQFEEAELFLELNDTDGDLGIHSSIDGGVWTELTIEGPGERRLMSLVSGGKLRAQGLTQLSFESVEPSFDELAPEQFFQRFPEGRYEIEGRLQDGREMESIAFLSHVLAAPPRSVTVGGVAAAENCNAPILPVVSAPVTIDWDPVTASHPELGKPGPVKVSRYQLFVEREGVKLSLDLPPDVTEFEVPPGLTRLGDEFKFEIIVRTAAGNNTAIESCFIVR
jgi:hypothetical protein